MSIKEFVKSELSGWKKSETIGLFIVFAIIFFIALLKKDSLIAVIYAVCGILYTIIAGKGKISCYFFGIVSSVCYGILAFGSALWGNLLLNLCYYLPMEILGIVKWRKYLKPKTKEIIKTRLTIKERILLAAFCTAGSAVFTGFLYNVGDKSPVFDGITTILSIAGMYLTVRRCIEQWIIWMFVNGLSVLMWIDIILKGRKAYGTVIVWLVYFILAVYFYVIWQRELSAPQK